MAQHNQAPPGADQNVGCPWQIKGPEHQVWFCWKQISIQAIHQKALGEPLSPLCMGELCANWRAHKRKEGLLRAREPEAPRTPA